MRRGLLVGIALLALSGCATRTVYVYPEIQIPAEPTLPKVQASELACLSDETYIAIAVRDQQRKAYADELRAIIAEHNRATKTR